MQYMKIQQDQDRFVALTGLKRRSENSKTGPMVQSYIYTHHHPVEARRDGEQKKVCGTCPLLKANAPDGKNRCYINALHASATWKATKDLEVAEVPEKLPAPLRFGSDGDPAYIEPEVREKLLEATPKDNKGRPKYTGYTHQWEDSNDEGLPKIAMASIDPLMAQRRGMTTLELRKEAHAKGYRVYRILEVGEEPQEGETICPHYATGVQCIDCSLCNGKRGATDKRKDIVAPQHGNGAAKF